MALRPLGTPGFATAVAQPVKFGDTRAEHKQVQCCLPAWLLLNAPIQKIEIVGQRRICIHFVSKGAETWPSKLRVGIAVNADDPS